jgi:hypothetical protein
VHPLGGEGRRPGRPAAVDDAVGAPGPVADRARLGAGADAQLALEDARHGLVAAERAGAVARPQQGAHQTDVRILVGGVERDQLLEPAGPAEELAVAQPQPLAGVERPVLVEVEGEQVAGVEVEGAVPGLAVPVVDRPGGQPLEPVDVEVDVDPVVGEERHGVAGEHHRGGPTRGLAHVVRGLVEPVGDGVGAGVGPERVDHLLAVDTAPAGQRQHLDEARRVAAQDVAADGAAVDPEVEPPEETDVHAHPRHVR